MAFKILLVEDNAADAHLLTELFAAIEDAPHIHHVADGYEALDYVFQRNKYKDAPRPDVLLLDLNLPRISGYEVLKELKDSPVLSGISVVVLTTSTHPFDHTQCKALGADLSLPKCNNLAEYRAMIQHLMTWARSRLHDAG